MKNRTYGWILLIIGGLGIIISAGIGSDWPMYAFIILSSAGTVLLICTRYRGSSPGPQVSENKKT